MDPREIDPRKWIPESNPEKCPGEIDSWNQKFSGIKTGPGEIDRASQGLPYPSSRTETSRPTSARSAARFAYPATTLAAALALASCDAGPAKPRELTEVEKICATQSEVNCMEAKVYEKRREQHAKALEEAGLLDTR